MQYGGGLMTEEVTVPGFVHNLHSINHWDLKRTPWYRDLELSARVRYVTPSYEFSQPHRDGTALVFARNLEETAASIARFSAKDAETFRSWNAKAEKITRQIFVPERFSEPLSRAERAELLEQTPAGREFLELTRQQPLTVITDLFENERVQVFLLFKLSLFGTVLYDMVQDESPTGSILRAFDIDTGYDLCVGGSWNLARGLMEVFIANGGTFINQARIERIILDGGRATGVETSDGRVIRARRFVASTVDVNQTFQQMIGPEQLPGQFDGQGGGAPLHPLGAVRGSPGIAGGAALYLDRLRPECQPRDEAEHWIGNPRPADGRASGGPRQADADRYSVRRGLRLP